MEDILRRSPVDFGIEASETALRNGFEVALDYGTDGPGPWLVDLSHKAKFDIEDSNLSQYQPFGLKIPETYNQCTYKNGIIINRMNRTQAYIWHLGDQEAGMPDQSAYTDLTDVHCLLALTGKDALAVMERVSSLDFGRPGLKAPCLFQGPICHIPCQVVLFKRDADSATLLFSFSRGYGQTMAETLLHAGSDVALKPGGEKKLVL